MNVTTIYPPIHKYISKFIPSHEHLSIQKFFIGSFVSSTVGRKIQLHHHPVLPGFRLIKSIAIQNKDNPTSVGLFLDKNRKKVIVKHLTYSTDLLTLFEFQNEIYILKKLNALSTVQSNKFPKIYNTYSTSNNLAIVMEYIHGKTLTRLNKIDQFNALHETIEYLSKINQFVPSTKKNPLPLRSRMFMFSTLPIYFILAIHRNHTHWKLFIKLLFRYYKLFFKSLLTPSTYVLTHRALHSRNIMKHKNNITIIDPQNTMLSEQFSDLAIIARMYLKRIGRIRTKLLINTFVKTKTDVDTFLRLSIYYPIQTIGITPTQDSHHKESITYLQYVDSHLIKRMYKNL